MYLRPYIYLQILFSLVFVPCSGDDTYEPCPAYPPLAEGDVLASDAEIQAALHRVDLMLSEAASKLPSGLVATVVYDQETIFSKGYGLRNASDRESGPPREDDLVRIASITKVFTDMLLYQMRDEGIVSLDDKLTQHMPDFKMQRAPGSHTRGAVRLRHLASHTSGLPREVPYPCSLNGKCNESMVLSELAKMMPVLPPNRRFHYSNLGLALLGRALGHAAVAKGLVPDSSAAYEAMISKNILRPMNMKFASFEYSDDTIQNMAVGTSADGSPIKFGETCGLGPGNSTTSWEAPCGCLWASAHHMATLMKLFFRDNERADAGEQIMDGDSIHEMLMPSVMLRDGSSAVGLPWEMKYSSGMWMKSKQGELPGYRSSITIVEPLKLGIFVSALVSDVDELSVWTIPALDILVPALNSTLWRLMPAKPLPRNHAAFVGSYYDGSVKVEVQGSSLLLIGGSSPPLNLIDIGIDNVLRATQANTTLGCRWLDDGQDQELVYFDVNSSSGRAHALRFMSAQYERWGEDAVVEVESNLV